MVQIAIHVKIGDKVKEQDAILTIEVQEGAASAEESAEAQQKKHEPEPVIEKKIRAQEEKEAKSLEA